MKEKSQTLISPAFAGWNASYHLGHIKGVSTQRVTSSDQRPQEANVNIQPSRDDRHSNCWLHGVGVSQVKPFNTLETAVI